MPCSRQSLGVTVSHGMLEHVFRGEGSQGVQLMVQSRKCVFCIMQEGGNSSPTGR